MILNRFVFQTIMARFPPIRSYLPKQSSEGTLCLQCEALVPKGRQKYCSDACLYLFLENHRWDSVRKNVLRRDGFRCQICSTRFASSKLHVDHIIPVRSGIDPFDQKNMRTLCKECHLSKTRLEKDFF